MSALLKIARCLTRFRPEPLPEFEKVELNDILKASIFIFYGGTELTEVVGNYVYNHKYAPAAFHAAGYVGDGKILNIGLEAKILDIKDEFRSTRRIDVIELLDLTDAERDIICRKFRRDEGHNLYDAAGFVRFGSKLKILRFLKNIHASNKNDFCSDNVVDNFSEPPLRRKEDTDADIAALTLPRKIEVSYYSSEDTAPWHLAEHAYDHPKTRRVRTLWTGADFKV